MKLNAKFFWIVMVTASALVADEIGSAELELVGREKFISTPNDGIRINARAYYSRKTGYALKSFHNQQSRSDTADVAYQRFSDDNGKTWTDPITVTTNRRTDRGTMRTYPRTGFVDPNRGVLIEFWLHGNLPTDDPLEGMKHWSLFYRLSRNGGRSAYHNGPVIHTGRQFSVDHPLPDVFIGRNSIMIGDQSCITIALRNGELLQPVQITPLGPNGEYYNPGGGYTYHDAAVLIGKWNQQNTIDWTISERVVADPQRSTRGMLEPTVAEFSDERILMVLRGSNHRKPNLPSYKWFSVSSDHGRSWSDPRPWTYTNGVAFYSPSSCSQLIKHSNGSIYWIGNICDSNPDGNLPRHPLVIGRVNPKDLLLIRETLCVVDTRREGDSAKLQVSNFFAREDRATGEILVHCSPLNRKDGYDQNGQPIRTNWTADAWLYRVRVLDE